MACAGKPGRASEGGVPQGRGCLAGGERPAPEGVCLIGAGVCSEAPTMSAKPSPPGTPGVWPGTSPSPADRYGERHRLQRIIDFPPGVIGPKKVRIYRRRQHYVLQWWDPAAKDNLSDRVDGDLVSAITRAREIEERLTHYKASGQVRQRRLGHADLVEGFLADLQRRADAGDIDPATVRRYDAALRHYLAFCGQPAISRVYPRAAVVNRDFRLHLAAFLAQREVTPNGRARAEGRPMKGQGFILDTVRALFEWAADPERGTSCRRGSETPSSARPRPGRSSRGTPWPSRPSRWPWPSTW